jgi:hypothetical protein
MQGLCLRSGQDYADRSGLHLRSTAPDDEALSRVHLFRTMEACLSYAFLWRACPGVRIGEIKEFTGADSSGTMLSVNERKAQAGSILAVVADLLTLNQQAVLDASFGGEHGERHAAIERLVCALEDANKNRTLIRMLLMREFVFGERYAPSQNAVARECGVSTYTASVVACKIAPAVAMLRDTAMETLRPAFARKHWVPFEES